MSGELVQVGLWHKADCRDSFLRIATILRWRGQAPSEDRTWPASAETASLLSLPLDQHASLPASVPVTAITDLLVGSAFFWTARDPRVLIHARSATPSRMEHCSRWGVASNVPDLVARDLCVPKTSSV